MEENKQFPNSSPLFFISGSGTGTSQDKIWIRLVLPVSSIAHFCTTICVHIYIHILLGWSNSWWTIKLCLHFPLISAASLGLWLLGLLSWDRLSPLDSFSCPHNFPLTPDPLSSSLFLSPCLLPEGPSV